VRDSSGTSGTGETPKGATRQEAHRPPRGKRASWNGSQPLPKATMFTETAFIQRGKSSVKLWPTYYTKDKYNIGGITHAY
jgi:hypothetical protein